MRRSPSAFSRPRGNRVRKVSNLEFPSRGTRLGPLDVFFVWRSPIWPFLGPKRSRPSFLLCAASTSARKRRNRFLRPFCRAPNLPLKLRAANQKVISAHLGLLLPRSPSLGVCAFLVSLPTMRQKRVFFLKPNNAFAPVAARSFRKNAQSPRPKAFLAALQLSLIVVSPSLAFQFRGKFLR